ncbi:zinc ABC transporter permease AztB [Sphingomonas sp. G5]
MSWLTDPFSLEFVQRALLGGVLVAVLCAVAGTWVIVRGMAFLGEALAHGMLPGVALATVLGVPVLIGAALSAVMMSLGIGAVQRRAKLSYDTSIGLLFVGMLALGVIVISHARSFATDATAILFGDILAVTSADLVVLAVAVVVGIAAVTLTHRSLVALAIDERVARVLGLGPRLAQTVLVGLVTLAVVASYQAVGSLLVVGLLVAPAVAARQWTERIPSTMVLAAGATIAATAIVAAGVSWLLRLATNEVRRRVPALLPVPA